MPRRKRKTELQETLDFISGLRDLVDETFEKLTGRRIAAWLSEFQQPGQLPAGEQAATQEPLMPLDRAYAIIGLPQAANIQQVKERYRALARVFHPDAPGGYEGAMVLLNNAYDRIKNEKGGN